MTPLQQALRNFTTAQKAVVEAIRKEYPIGSECVFVWSDDSFHVGRVEGHSIDTALYVKSKLNGKTYQVRAPMVVAGEKLKGKPWPSNSRGPEGTGQVVPFTTTRQ